MGSYIEAASQIIQTFGTDLWSSVKESQLTQSVTRLASCHSEATNVGDAHSATLASTWHAGLTDGKSFLAAYREYLKAQQRFQRLAEIALHVRGFYEFLTKSASVKPFPSFTLLWHRANLYDDLRIAGLKAAIQKALGNGLGSTLVEVESLPCGSTKLFSADAWLQSNLLRAACEIIKAYDMTDCAEFFAKTADDFKGALVALQEALPIPDVCAQALADFKSIGVLVAAAIDPCLVRPSAVAQALKSLDDKRLGGFRSEILDSACGKHIIGAATMMMQISSRDTAGDDKLGMAQKGLIDLRLASWAPGGTDPKAKMILNNFGVIHDMTMAAALNESLSYVLEAEGLWTEGRATEKETDLIDFVTAFLGHMRVIDDGCTIFLDSLANQGEVARLLGVGTSLMSESQDAMADESHEPSFQRISALLEDSGIDEDPLEKVAGNFHRFLTTERALSASGLQIFEEFAEATKRHIANIEIRATITACMYLLAELGPPPRSSPEALGEWKAKSLSGKAQGSFVVNAIRLQEMMNQLKVEELAIGFGDMDDGEAVLHFGEGDTQSIECGIPRVSAAYSAVIASPYIQKISSIVAGVIQLVVDDFADSLMLPAIRMPPPIIDELATNHGGIVSLLNGFFSKSYEVEVSKLAGKVFVQSSAKDHSWPCGPLRSLATDLINAAPQDNFSISLENFCEGGNDDALKVWTDKKLCRSAFSLLEAMSQVMASLTFISVRIANKDCFTKECTMKDEVEAAVSFCKATSLRMADEISKHPTSASMTSLTWKAPVGSAASWFAAASAVMPHVCKLLVKDLVLVGNCLAKELQQCTPQHGHIVDNDKIALKLAKRNLLEWPRRNELNIKSKLLFHSLANAARLHSHWALTPAFREVEVVKEELDESYSLFKRAATAIVAIAAITVLVDQTGERQKTNASDLLARKRDELPASIVTELQKVVSSRSAGGQSAASSSV